MRHVRAFIEDLPALIAIIMFLSMLLVWAMVWPFVEL